MKCLYCKLVRAIFPLCLISLFVLSNVSINAQQSASLSGQTASPQPNADSVVLTVTVTDKNGRVVRGLDKSAFSIYDSKNPQEISFFAAEDEPVSIGILFDLSGSMKRNALEIVREALLRFIRLSNSANEYFLIGFSDRPDLLFGWARAGQAFDELSKLDLTSKKNTALYDACYIGIEKMGSSAYRKQVFLLISDGNDNVSKHSFNVVRERLRESQAILYSINLFSDELRASLGMEGQAVMSELSSITGGMFLFPETKTKAEQAFDQIALELRNQYLIGFKPSAESADGKWHGIKVKVTPSPTALARGVTKLSVRSRESYRVVKNQP